MATSRRIGARDSATRAKLLDAAEALMLDEGYAAVTSRRVGQRAGIAPQLVHYYFESMDDLFLEVFRRRADDGLARFQTAIGAKPTLRTIWRAMNIGPEAAINVEFVALANHRKEIRAEIAVYAERFRTMQLDAIEKVLAADPLPMGLTPEIVLVALAGVAQLLTLERALGVSGGHEEIVTYLEQRLRDSERP